MTRHETEPRPLGRGAVLAAACLLLLASTLTLGSALALPDEPEPGRLVRHCGTQPCEGKCKVTPHDVPPGADCWVLRLLQP